MSRLPNQTFNIAASITSGTITEKAIRSLASGVERAVIQGLNRGLLVSNSKAQKLTNNLASVVNQERSDPGYSSRISEIRNSQDPRYKQAIRQQESRLLLQELRENKRLYDAALSRYRMEEKYLDTIISRSKAAGVATQNLTDAESRLAAVRKTISNLGNQNSYILNQAANSRMTTANRLGGQLESDIGQQNKYSTLAKQTRDFLLRDARAATREAIQQTTKSIASLSRTRLYSEQFFENQPIIERLTQERDSLESQKRLLNTPGAVDRLSDLDLRRGALDTRSGIETNRQISDGAKLLNQTNSLWARQSKLIAQAQNSAAAFGDQVGLAAKRYGAFLIGTASFFAIINSFRTATEEAKNFEKAQTRLSQILSVDRGQVSPITSRAQSLASQTGVSAVETLRGVDIFAQAGFQDIEQLQYAVEKLAKVPLTATFGSIEETSDGLIAVFRQFNKELSQTGYLFDIINKVAADYAVEVKDVFEGVKRGGSVFAETGGSFEQFLQYFTLLRDRTRESSETIGVFFKSIGFRLFRRSNDELFKQLGITGRTLPERLEQSATAFNKLFGNRVEGNPDAVRLAERIAGLQQGGRFIAQIAAINENRRTGKFSRSLSGSTGSFENETDKRLSDISVSFERIQQSINNIVAGLTQNQVLRQSIKIFADIVVYGSKLGDLFNSLAVPVAALIATLGARPAGAAIGSFTSRLFPGFSSSAASRRLAEQIIPTEYDQNTYTRNRSNLDRQRRLYVGIERQAFADRYNLPIDAVPFGRRNRSRIARRNFVRNNLGTSIGLGVSGLFGFGTSLASDYLNNIANESIQKNGLTNENTSVRAAGNAIGTIGGSVATFAALGSIIPGVGTALGALTGVIVGGTLALYNYNKEVEKNTNSLLDQNLGRATTEESIKRIGSSLGTRDLQNRFLDNKSNETLQRIYREEIRKNPTSLRFAARNVINRTGLRNLQTNTAIPSTNLVGGLAPVFNVSSTRRTSVEDSTIERLKELALDKQKITTLDAIDLSNNYFDNLRNFFDSVDKNLSDFDRGLAKYTSRIGNITSSLDNVDINKILDVRSSRVNSSPIRVLRESLNLRDLYSKEISSLLQDPAVNSQIRSFVNQDVSVAGTFGGVGEARLNNPNIQRFAQILNAIQLRTGNSTNSGFQKDLVKSIEKDGTAAIEKAFEQSSQFLNKFTDAINKAIDGINNESAKRLELSNAIIAQQQKINNFADQISGNNFESSIRSSTVRSILNNGNNLEIGRINSNRINELTGGIDVGSAFNTASINRANIVTPTLGNDDLGKSLLNLQIQSQANTNTLIDFNIASANVESRLNKLAQAYDIAKSETDRLVESFKSTRDAFISFGSNELDRQIIRNKRIEGRDIRRSERDFGSFLTNNAFGRATLNGNDPRAVNTAFSRFNSSQQRNIVNELDGLRSTVGGLDLKGVGLGNIQDLLNAGDTRLREITFRRIAELTTDTRSIGGKRLTQSERESLINTTQSKLRDAYDKQKEAAELALKREKEIKEKQNALIELQLQNAQRENDTLEKRYALIDRASLSFADAAEKLNKISETALVNLNKAAESLNNFIQSGGSVNNITIDPIQVNVNFANTDLFAKYLRDSQQKMKLAVERAITEALTGSGSPEVKLPEESGG